MNTPTIDDFIIFFYVLAEEALKGVRFKKPGPKPACSDAEILTLAFFQQLKHIESESEFLRQNQAELEKWVPSLPRQQEYNRRLKDQETLLSELFNVMLELTTVEMTDQKAYQDTAPISVTRHSRKPHGHYQAEAELGYCATKKMYFWGYFLHLVVSPEGIPLQFTLLPAGVDEIAVLNEPFLGPFRGYEIGADKGYLLNPEKHRLLDQIQVTLTHPYRKNQHRENTFAEKTFLKKRGVIERVYSWLEGKCFLESTLAKTFDGLTFRIWRKLLFFGFCILFNSLLGNPLLQISKLWH